MFTDDAVRIPLLRGGCAIIDAADISIVEKFNWHAHSEKCGLTYARASILGTGRKIKMHRLLLDAPNGVLVDHRDGDGLNNRRENIRLATSLENQRNQRLRSDSTSGLKGVTWHKARNKWYSQIRLRGKHIHLGVFDDKQLAALAYDNAARELFGEFARLNFPQPQLPSK